MTTEPTNLRARSYRDLVVWQKAMVLVTEVYRLSATWPSEERFGLTSQVRRAAVSIPANLAEGQGRIGTKEFTRFVAIAHGSLCELETEIMVARNLCFCTEADVVPCRELMDEVGKMCRALLKSGNAQVNGNERPR